MDPRELQIVALTGDIFMKYGIRSVSMDDIAREMGISKKTLYHYFSNKAELLSRVIDFSNSIFENHIAIREENGKNAIDDLMLLSKYIDKHIASFNPVFSFDLKKFYPEVYKESLEKKRTVAYHYICENIRKGISEEIYRPDLNIDLVARLYVRKLEDLHQTDYYDRKEVGTDEVFRVMIENHIRGISNEKGIKYFEVQHRRNSI